MGTRRKLLEDRWQLLMRDVERFEGENAISGVNSERFKRIDETLDELAAMLVEEVNEDEADSLEVVKAGVWKAVKAGLIAWAETVEIERAEKRRLTVV